MPAFTFEKIPGPPRIEPGRPIPAVKRRGALAMFLDRLASARMRRTERDIDRAKRAVKRPTPSPE